MQQINTSTKFRPHQKNSDNNHKSEGTRGIIAKPQAPRGAASCCASSGSACRARPGG